MSAFLSLSLEAMGDAVRRRIVAVITFVSILSLMLVDNCTSCATGQLVIDGELRDLVNVSGYTGSMTFAVLGLWCVALAGVLSAEHLATTLSDGSATLALARPVSRGSFAFARLTGALLIAFVTGALLLGGSTFLLVARNELTAAPALLASACCALAAVGIGALAMSASLFLPRIATVMLVLVGVAAIALANGVGLVSDAGGGLLFWIDRLGPPLLSAPALALDPWMPGIDVPGEAGALGLRLLLWAAGSLALLGWSFGRIELDAETPQTVVSQRSYLASRPATTSKKAS